MATKKAVQDYYPDDIAVCYGCGKSNKHGYQIKTYWEGEETVSRFQPEPYHTAFPGYVYGGLIASLIDCHANRHSRFRKISRKRYSAEYRRTGAICNGIPARQLCGTDTDWHRARAQGAGERKQRTQNGDIRHPLGQRRRNRSGRGRRPQDAGGFSVKKYLNFERFLTQNT